jgi:UDP-glucose 4-epimerase
VHDVIRGVLMLDDEPRAHGEVFNIGTMEEVSVHALATRVRDIVGSTSPIDNVEYETIYGSRFEDMQRRVPSLDKIHALVGYEPRVTLDALLRETVEHMRARMGAGAQVPTSAR